MAIFVQKRGENTGYKKVNDKPMVIHKKKNTRLHVKSAAKAKRKSERLSVAGKTVKVEKMAKGSIRIFAFR